MIKANFVILAGGSGERLWPLSSATRPKQLIPFINGTSLLEQTLQRIRTIVPDKNHLLVVTNKDQQEPIKASLKTRGTVLAEPMARNTAAATLLACMQIAEKNPDAVVVVLPSDHFIPDAEKFTAQLVAAISFAAWMDQIALLGVKPTHAATGYGYIQYQKDTMMSGWVSYPVTKFHEKPEKQQAESYIKDDAMLWNVGIFVARAKLFIDEFARLAPDLYHSMQAYLQGTQDYSTLPAISMDHAVIEKSDKVVVFPSNFQWYDVGNLTTFLSLKAQYEKEQAGNVVNIQAHNNIACCTKKSVAFVGVDNLCVVETDDELLIVAQDQVENVRHVLQSMKEKPLVEQAVQATEKQEEPELVGARSTRRAKKVVQEEQAAPEVSIPLETKPEADHASEQNSIA